MERVSKERISGTPPVKAAVTHQVSQTVSVPLFRVALNTCMLKYLSANTQLLIRYPSLFFFLSQKTYSKLDITTTNTLFGLLLTNQYERPSRVN